MPDSFVLEHHVHRDSIHVVRAAVWWQAPKDESSKLLSQLSTSTTACFIAMQWLLHGSHRPLVELSLFLPSLPPSKEESWANMSCCPIKRFCPQKSYEYLSSALSALTALLCWEQLFALRPCAQEYPLYEIAALGQHPSSLSLAISSHHVGFENQDYS